MAPITSPQLTAAALSQLWSPQVIMQTAELSIKVARIEGTMGWHSHEHEEKIFMVLQGSLRIEMADSSTALKEGEMLLIPKGIAHRPVAEQECHIMFIEPRLYSATHS
jgi:mannose-6-phosphate isomerase-like protein (cupin superfamily)